MGFRATERPSARIASAQGGGDPLVDPIEAVAARMQAVAAPLGPDDGVRRCILERVQEEIKDRFTTGAIRTSTGPAAAPATWSPAGASHTRNNAWTQAQTLDALAGSAFLRTQFLDALGRNVGFAGRAAHAHRLTGRRQTAPPAATPSRAGPPAALVPSCP
jgi:hypothetical protein